MLITGIQASAGMKPTTPTIGTASDGGTGTTASVAFTPSTYIGKGTITYTATSSPGSLTGTGSGSPITVSGLTTGTAYTFTVKGTTNYGVTSDNSAASNSVTPANPSSFESIATITASGGEASLTFSSIPGTYKSLQIRGIARDTYSSALNTSSLVSQFNSDAAYGNYAFHQLYGNGTSTIAVGYPNNDLQAGFSISSGNSNTQIYGVSLIDIIDYASTNKYKTVRQFCGADLNGATAGTAMLSSGLWKSTSAITSIKINCQNLGFAAGTKFALYGIKG